MSKRTRDRRTARRDKQKQRWAGNEKPARREQRQAGSSKQKAMDQQRLREGRYAQ